MKTHVLPLGSKLVVRRMEEQDRTPGGIVLPDVAKEKPRRGTVLAMGPGRTLENGQLSIPQTVVGDEVLFATYGGTEIDVDGEKLLVLDEADLLAILRVGK